MPESAQVMSTVPRVSLVFRQCKTGRLLSIHIQHCTMARLPAQLPAQAAVACLWPALLYS